MKLIQNLLENSNFRLFLKYAFWFFLIFSILASISLKELLFVEQNPFFYEMF